MKVGRLTWQGNQADGTEVSDAASYPWTPDAAIVLSEDFNGVGYGGALSIDLMGADQSKLVGGAAAALVANAVQSFVEGGITIGTHGAVNLNNATKDYTALIFQAHADDLVVGQYTGNGTSQDITTPGWTPDLVIIVGASATEAPVIWIDNYPDGSFQRVGGNNLAVLSNGVSDHASGFSVGSANAVNESGVEFYYLAFKEAAGVFEHVRLSGNGADDRAVANDSQFQAEEVWGKRADTGTAYFFMWHTTDAGLATDSTGKLSTDADGEANLIQEITATGMEVGSGASANGSGANIDYWFWKSGDSQPEASSGAGVPRHRREFF